ncbi:MetQ/NlpA family ABC transporter substrate-binding protein [Eupransor demetentiae]|uniref:Periplasmic component/surface antigen (NlpA) n=1 Tax=Eupransor demetentiae TaxID=3109584 RepID=A0ABM9N4A8_9LACO|nr:ABC-type metal ion transport system [Lactobacillaceae bacterium LMG 33000]
MSKIKKFWPLALVVLLGFFAYISFIKPAQHHSSQNKTIVLGSTPAPFTDLFLKGIKPILVKEGYQVRVKSFSNLLNADIALNDNEVDLNVDQHTAYLNNFNAEKKGHLVALTKIPTSHMGIYPAQKKTLAEVSRGNKVAVPDDPSNAARAYRLMEKAGWIKLRSGVNPLKATKRDIAENPYNLDLIEVDSSTIPRIASDFDYTIIPGSVAYAAKISVKKMLLAETVQSDYFLVAATNQKNANSDWAKAVTKAYQSKEFADYMKKHNSDNYWEIPKY